MSDFIQWAVSHDCAVAWYFIVAGSLLVQLGLGGANES